MLKTISLFAALSLFSGLATALTPDQLTLGERTQYQALSKNPKDEERFLVTRDYVRKAQAVVDGKASARNFPGKPKDFASKFISSDEKDLINQAVMMSIKALAESR